MRRAPAVCVVNIFSKVGAILIYHSKSSSAKSFEDFSGGDVHEAAVCDARQQSA